MTTPVLRRLLAPLLVVAALAGCGEGGEVGAVDFSGSPASAESISISPSTQTIGGGAQVEFTATLQDAPSGTVVTWSLSGPDCVGAACGTLSAGSGSTVTYTAPAVAPSPNATVTVTAAGSSARDSATLTIMQYDAALDGDYVFELFGFDVAPQSYPGVTLPTGAIGMVGRFHADGIGNLSHIEFDIDHTGGTQHGGGGIGSYSVDGERRGTLTINTGPASGITLRFVVHASGNGQLIEYDNTPGTGRIASGKFRKQDFTAFSLGVFNGDFVFGMAGEIPGNPPDSGRLAMVGRFTSDASGAITLAHETSNYGASAMGSAALSAIDANSGRGTASWTIPNFRNGLPLTSNFAFYVVDFGHAVFITTSGREPAGVGFAGVAFLVGEARDQHLPTASPYLSGPAIYYTSGVAMVGTDYLPLPTVGRLDFSAVNSSSGTVDSGKLDQRIDSWVETSISGGTFTVAVDPQEGGRTDIGLANGYSATLYLSGPNAGFVLGRTGGAGELGVLEPHVPGGIAGHYVGTTWLPGLAGSPNATFTLTLLANNQAAGTSDRSTAQGLTANAPFGGDYSPVGAMGRYQFDLDGSMQERQFIGWSIKPGKLLLLPTTSRAIPPVLFLAEQ